MCTSLKICIFLVLVGFCLLQNSHQDVAHLYAPTTEFNYYKTHHPLHGPPAHFPLTFQSAVSTLYGYPINDVETAKPGVAPVAAISSSSEQSLPEVVENRSKDRKNFIPLLKQYLPPDQTDNRPNYESPALGNPQYDLINGGYIYQKPNYARPSTTTANPMTVFDHPEFMPPIILPAISNDSNEAAAVLPAPTAPSYDYNTPSTPIPLAADTPFNQPAAGYLPPSKDQQYLVGLKTNTTKPLRLRVQEMRCLQQQSKTNGYLRAVFKVDSFLSATPSVDNDSSDKRCEIKLDKSYMVLDIAGEDFERCGVQQCGTDLCLRLRLPAIRGMRTVSDNILTLHCKTQNRVAVKTHAVKMGVANDVQARSIGVYAKGGTQNSFRTHVELLRKTAQGYVRLLRADEAVQLGEELLLRAHVLTGDGWSHTKLTDVSLQRISPSGEILNIAQLITSQGCLNPSMKGVCTQTPTFDAPLGYKLPFKAVMFQGMRSGEDLIMAMRITGCLEHHDCYVNPEQCRNYNVSNLKRHRREMLNNTEEVSEISRISFKVIRPEATSSATSNPTENLKTQTTTFALFGSLGFVALLICLGIFVLIKFKKY